MTRGPIRRRTGAAGRRALLAAGALILAGSACRAGAREAGVPRVANPFAASPLWDDGRAEVCAYEATEMRYGIGRPFTAYHIVVKEDFSRRQLVKADPGHDPADLMPVLKLNRVIYLRTGIYSYHQMASTFYERASMDLVKFTLASFEWCGNSFKEYTRRGDRAALHAHTYWDDQAEATYPIPADADVILYDQLPLWIRSLPQEPGTTLRLRLVPSQIGSRGPAPVLSPATLQASREEPITTPAGSFHALRWELRAAGGEPDLFWTAREFPHLLVAWDRPDGSHYRLRWAQRLRYWELNRPGDERYLEGPGQAPEGGD